jgi:hypothetical protein
MRKQTAWWTAAVTAAATMIAAAVFIATQGAQPIAAATYGNMVITDTAAVTPQLVDALKSAVAAVPDGTVGIAVYDRAVARMLIDYRGSVAFPAESVVKLLIAMDDLDHGGQPEPDAEMLSRSDDATASRLWAANGQTAVVTRMAGIIGLTATIPPRAAGRWGDTSTTAEDLVKVYQYLLNRAPTMERHIILNALDNATHNGADGFDQYFGIPDAAGDRPWGVKQGWACCKPDRVLNTTGVLDSDRRYIVVVLTEHSSSTSWAHDTQQITAAVQALLPALPR